MARRRTDAGEGGRERIVLTRVATMRAAALVAPGSVRIRDVPVPEGDTLVRIEGCGVCGSSLPVWEGRPWFAYPLEPGAPGHEAWGEAEDGRRVAFLTQNGYAEWAVVDESSLVEVPFSGPFPGEALGCAVNVVKRARIRPDTRVAIVGMGFLGSAVSQLVEAVEVRRDDEPRGEFDCVIECAGTQGALDTASRLVATGGTLVLAGFHQDGRRTIDLQSWNWRGIDVVNAHERDPRACVDAMREAVLLFDLERLVTHRFPLERLADAFEAARMRPPGFVKAVVLT